MKKLMFLAPVFAIVAFTACMTSPTASEAEAEAQADQSITEAAPAAAPQPITLPQEFTIIKKGQSLPPHAAALECHLVFGTCKLARCEEPLEPTQNMSEVCCSDGSCTTRNFRVCGCD
jgi:hypothetical protein